MQRQSDIEVFYDLMRQLEFKTGGLRRLGDCHGRMTWPKRGVYFFFEPGEYRSGDPRLQRVVRVGTHALAPKSRTTLWNRLSQHRGTTNPPGGNHRGSIFRLLVGEAIINSEQSLPVASWGKGSTAARDIRDLERTHETRVSQYLGDMKLLHLDVPDEAGRDSARGVIERNSIALLSGFREPAPDPPSLHWLGRYSGRERVRRSGLWNNNHVEEAYDPDFLNLLEDLVRRMADT
ncbi:MAG: hypothetical protein KDK08_27615 [Rhizobiaceae bacterium]|nr:hypothetical protein [Rhizobiaceae bacterium]